jgi:hypothetical protein
MIDAAAGLPCCAAMAGQAFVSVFWLQPCACTKWMPALMSQHISGNHTLIAPLLLLLPEHVVLLFSNIWRQE